MVKDWTLLLLISLSHFLLANAQITVVPLQTQYDFMEDAGVVEICLRVDATATNSNELFEVSVDTSAMPSMEPMATINSDYILLNNSINLTDSASNQSCAMFHIIDDDAAEGTEYINVTLSSTNATIDPSTILVAIQDNDVVIAMVDGSVSIAEGQQARNICITYSPPSGGYEFSFTVTAEVSDGLAFRDMDFTVQNTMMDFSPSSNSVMMCVLVNAENDNEVEGNETFTIDWTPSNNAVQSASTIVTIYTVGGMIIVGAVQTSYSVMEGGGPVSVCVEVTETLSTDQSFTVTLDVSSMYSTASQGSDYVAPQHISLQDTANNQECADIFIVDDMIVEGTEHINLTLSTSQNDVIIDPSTVIVTITDNDELKASVESSISLTEGTARNVCITYTAPSGGSQLTFEVEVNITNGLADSNDYTVEGSPLMFNQTVLTGCVLVTAIYDSDQETSEDFIITWSPFNSLAQSAVTVITILELNDTILNGTSVSGEEGTSISICIGIIEEVNVQLNYTYSLISGTASAADYSASMHDTVSIAAGSLGACFPITLADDSIVEGTENFTVTLTSPANVVSSITVMITDLTVATIGFEESSVTIDEDIGVYSTQLTITSPPGDNVTINIPFYVTVGYSNGTAIAGRDFIFIDNNPILWGVSEPPVVNVTIENDQTVEFDETFSLSLAVVMMGGVNIDVNVPQQEITIDDNDNSTILTLSTVTYDESSGTVSFCFGHTNMLARRSDNSDYVLNYNVVDGSAGSEDYTLESGSVVIPLNPSEPACIDIIIKDDELVEGNKMFTINWSLEGSVPDIRIQNSMTTFIIQDNDVLPMITPTSSSLPPPTTSTSQAFSIYAVIGIIVGVVAAGVCFLLVLVCVICCVKIRMNRQGFYATNEDKGEAPQMLRYSASLRSLQSQTVMPADPRDKENEYMV